MSELSARLGLPLMAAGQAQKELTHNEALLIADFASFPVVESAVLSAPPIAPQPGQCWIIGAAPTGEWQGKVSQIACWSLAGWRYITPRAGFGVYDLNVSKMRRFDGSSWDAGQLNASAIKVDGVQVVGQRQAAITAPTGGTTSDSEARVAISAILDTLRTHGLIAQ